MAKKDDSKKSKKAKPENAPKSISVGKNVNKSNVVIGDNTTINNYFPIVEKNTEKHEPDFWNLKHPYPMPPNFTGRIAERALLTLWLNDDTENRLFILRALGGFGKSALTWHWLTHDVDPKAWKKVIFWSFYEGDSSFESFVKETLEYLKIEVPQGGRTQVDELLKALQKEKVLLIMDGFERVLRAYSSMNAAYQGDEEPKLEENQFDCVNLNAEIFLKSICSLPNIKSKALMTTRLTPRVIKPRGEFMLGCKEFELTAMQKEDAIEFFRKQGIKGNHAEIESVCARYGYHPLSLRILTGYILKDFENPADIAVAQKLKIDGNIIQQKNHVMKVAYDTLLINRQKLLSTIACFRSPVELKTLEEITENKDSLNSDLQDLIERGLLHFDIKNKRFDLHPIVRQYSYDRFTDSERKKVHIELASHFIDVIPVTNKNVKTLEDLAPVIELYHHMVRAWKSDEAVKLFYNRLHNILYYQLGAYQLYIELLHALFIDGEDKSLSLKEESWQAWTFNALALVYSINGQPRRALPLFLRNADYDEKHGRKEQLSTGLANMAHSTQRHIGALKEAEHNLCRAIELDKELESKTNEAFNRNDLGHLLIYKGDWSGVEQQLDLGYTIFKWENNSQALSVNWLYRTLRFLLIAREGTILDIRDLKVEVRISEPEHLRSAIESAGHALELADETSKRQFAYPRDYVDAYWYLGAAYRMKGDLNKAEENLSKAINMCRQINLVEMEADILLELAKLRYAQKNYEEAKSLVDEALIITERCGYVLQGADVNLFLSQYALEQEKDKVKAKEYAETALKLAYCDGPPYYYKVAYHEAEAMLEKISKEK